ncbi:MAG TPA: GrpB family protein [Steroidobacteraceae bacterium]|nr:GrpB family protein [Steroidobacteraceae bacterium]
MSGESSDAVGRQDPMVIQEYDPAWPARFQAIAAVVWEALGDVVQRIEHVGSTAVPGLAAKPIIDVDVVVWVQSQVPEAMRRLDVLGYVHEGDLGIAGRDAFRSPSGGAEHHLYLLVEGAAELTRHLAFRDALRGDTALRERYADLKRHYAARHRSDRAAYTDAKSALINTVLKAANLQDCQKHPSVGFVGAQE